MERFKKFVMDNFQLMIPILFMFVLFVAFLSYYHASVHSNYKVDSDVDVYQYFFDRKYEYKATVSKNRKGVIVDYHVKDAKINLDSTPIYLKKGDTVIFPSDMDIVMPTLSCAEYVSLKYSYVDFNNGIYTLTTNRYHNKLNHYFLYDGKDLYFFIEPVTLEVNNEKITLSPYSYVVALYNQSLSYYDRKNDVYKTLTIGNHDIVISNDYYRILVDRDMVDYQGTNVILSSSSNFDKLNTIDKKG